MLPPADPTMDEEGKEGNGGSGRADADVGRRDGGGVVQVLDDISELA